MQAHCQNECIHFQNMWSLWTTTAKLLRCTTREWWMFLFYWHCVDPWTSERGGSAEDMRVNRSKHITQHNRAAMTGLSEGWSWDFWLCGFQIKDSEVWRSALSYAGVQTARRVRTPGHSTGSQKGDENNNQWQAERRNAGDGRKRLRGPSYLLVTDV